MALLSKSTPSLYICYCDPSLKVKVKVKVYIETLPHSH